MNVSAKEIPRQQLFFTDYWNMYKKYYDFWSLPEKDKNKIWEDIINEQRTITEKYKDDDFYFFVRDMTVAMILEFERKCKNKTHLPLENMIG